MLLYRVRSIEEYSKENFTKEGQELPPPLREYAEMAKEGVPRARRLAAMKILAELLAHARVRPAPIEVGKYGKPDFASGGYHFSISHTKQLCAVALSDRYVGIDMEEVFTVVPPERIARLSSRFFPEERQLIAESSHPSQTFLEIWVKKEAIVKRTGRGLADLPYANTVKHRPRIFERTGSMMDLTRAFLAIY